MPLSLHVTEFPGQLNILIGQKKVYVTPIDFRVPYREGVCPWDTTDITQLLTTPAGTQPKTKGYPVSPVALTISQRRKA